MDLLKRYGAVFVLLLLPALAVAMGAGPDPDTRTASPKPGSPVSVSIEPVAGVEPRPGDMVELLVSARTGVAGPLEVRIRLTGGAELIRGELSWTADLDSGEETTGLITVRFPGKGRPSVRASASVKEKGPHGGRYSDSAVLVVGDAPVSRTEGRAGTDSEGREIIEYGAE